MSDDIVKTLRAMADSLSEGWVMVEAADEIERLRSEVGSLRTALESVTIVAGKASVEGLTFKDIKRGRVVVNNEGSAMEGN